MATWDFAQTYGYNDVRTRYKLDRFFEISKQKWWHYLEVLPPMRWQRYDSVEWFFVSECITGNYYQCCIRLEDSYYTAAIDKDTTNQHILERLRLAIDDQAITVNEWPTTLEVKSILGIQQDELADSAAKFARQAGVDIRLMNPDHHQALIREAAEYMPHRYAYPYDDDLIEA